MVLIPGGNVASKVSMYRLKSVDQGLDGSKFAADVGTSKMSSSSSL